MPIKTDAANQTYYDGDNIRVTASDLAWIKSGVRPREEMPKCAHLALVESANREIPYSRTRTGGTPGNSLSES